MHCCLRFDRDRLAVLGAISAVSGSAQAINRSQVYRKPREHFGALEIEAWAPGQGFTMKVCPSLMANHGTPFRNLHLTRPTTMHSVPSFSCSDSYSFSSRSTLYVCKLYSNAQTEIDTKMKMSSNVSFEKKRVLVGHMKKPFLRWIVGCVTYVAPPERTPWYFFRIHFQCDHLCAFSF